MIAELTAQKAFGDAIATEVTAAPVFYVAEDYHQEYFANNGYQPYCQAVVAPKVAKFRKKFASRIKP
jgi:peptide-methionine (S)-S-oxide reductase